MENSQEKQVSGGLQAQSSDDLKFIGLIMNTVVHSLNNTIGLIHGYADLSLRAADPDSRVYPYLKNISDGADSLKELSEKMRIFSKQEKQDLTLMNIHVLVEEAVNSFAASLTSSVEVQKNIDPACGTVLADEAQIRQVVTNLCRNAYDAVRDKGGVIEVSLMPRDVDAAFAEAHKNLEEGRYLNLAVKDTGCGMNQEISSRIYEPFFTTKGAGGNAGLGLTVVQAIVKNHKGSIFVESKPGEGTEFDVFLPGAE